MKTIDLGLGGGSLLQIANRTLTQMMSYIIDTPEGNVIVIDGGYYCPEDAQNLYEELKKRDLHVDLWLITHAHCDHLGALLWLIENLPVFDIRIDKLCYNFPDEQWISKRKPSDQRLAIPFLRAVETLNLPVYTPVTGDIFSCGSVSLEIISHPEEYASYPNINPTSLITIAHFPKRNVLFLGDFDIHGQTEFLRKRDVSKLRVDIVQMAHHGQNGIDRAFYELIRPKICLYTAPDWLWENNLYRCNDPATAGKGPFTTLETRRWMEELGAEASYSLADGDCLFI